MTRRRAWQNDILASMSPRDEPDDKDDKKNDFGFYHDIDDVQLAWVGLRRFNQLPYAGGWFDQPYHLLMDILTYDRLFEEENEGFVFYPTDTYEEQISDLEKRIQF